MRVGKRVHIIIAFAVCLSGAQLLLGQTTEKRSVEGLIYDLKHPDANKRKEAAGIIGQNSLRQAVPALIEASQDPDPAVRLEVVRALVKINDSRALQSFIRLAHDQGDRRIQESAVKGIVQVYVTEEEGFVSGLKKVVDFVNPLSDGYNPLVVEPYVPVSQDAVTALSDLLFISDKGLRKDAAAALGILRARTALPAIQEALQREDQNDVKLELIRSVYKIGDPAGSPAIIPLIRDPDKRVHDEAILVAGRLRAKEAVPPLTELYTAGVEERQKVFGLLPVSGSDDLQKKILEALAYIGDPQSENIFESALADERDAFRRFGAEGLGRSNAKSYVSLVARKYLREKKKDVKLAMSYALFRLGRDEHLVELVDNVEGAQTYYYLLEFTPEETKSLYPFVQTEKDSIKVRLLDVIGMRGDREALALVEEMSKDESVEVASAANLALRRLRARFPQG